MSIVLEQLLSMTLIGTLLYVSGRLFGCGKTTHEGLRLRYALEGLALFFYLIPVGVPVNMLLRLFGSTSLPDALRLHLGDDTGSSAVYPLLTVSSLSRSVLCGLLLIWLAGAIVCLVRQRQEAGKLSRFLRLRTTDCHSELLLGLFREECVRLDLRRCPSLRESAQISSPFIMLLGGRFYVLVPAEHDFSAEEWRLMLRHELIHFCRRDLWIRRLMLLGDLLHWFNPLWHRYRRDMLLRAEIACDGRLIRELSREERRRYGEVLLKTAGPNCPAVIAGLSRSGRLLRERLRYIAAPEILHIRRPWLLRGMSVLAACLGLAAACLMQDLPMQTAGLLFREQQTGLVESEETERETTPLRSAMESLAFVPPESDVTAAPPVTSQSSRQTDRRETGAAASSERREKTIPLSDS